MVQKNFGMRIGSRAQVFHGTAKQTSGGLRRSDLKKNKRGAIVSKKASARAKKENRLVKAGYVTQRGKFGVVQRGGFMFKYNGSKYYFVKVKYIKSVKVYVMQKIGEIGTIYFVEVNDDKERIKHLIGGINVVSREDVETTK